MRPVRCYDCQLYLGEGRNCKAGRCTPRKQGCAKYIGIEELGKYWVKWREKL